ncbi:DUF397 domain-containing protein [Streptomyces niveus]|uniref:DUF397 domain-containing protein n=1 Tax=Streptomyces niveus TaxID=193462 RepID=UPI0036A7CC41
MNHEPLRWRKSSYSGQTGGDCIELAQPSEAGILVRDSKNAGGPHLTLTSAAWVRFVSAASTGLIESNR